MSYYSIALGNRTRMSCRPGLPVGGMAGEGVIP